MITYKLVMLRAFGEDKTLLKVETEKLPEGEIPKEFKTFVRNMNESTDNGETFYIKKQKDCIDETVFYINKHKLSPEEMIEKGYRLSEDSFRTLLWDRQQVHEEVGEYLGFTREKTTVVKGLDNKLYAIQWEEGLGDYPDLYKKSPEVVELEERQVMRKEVYIVYPENKKPEDQKDDNDKIKKK